MRDIDNKYKVNIDSGNCKHYKFEKMLCLRYCQHRGD